MDSVEYSRVSYNLGIRAYIVNGIEIHQNALGDTWPPASMELWHALRAYQDEQRKKGVPITYDSVEDQLPEPYVSEGVMATYLCQFGGGIEIQLAKYTGPRERTYRIARFTNFRWREGYPKHA